MRSFDLSPLYRSAIGFDRVANLLDSLQSTEQSQPNYPPYNIEVADENEYRISMAVAGFSREELEIEAEQNKLTVRGRKGEQLENRNFLHRGIATRNFERRFQLADHVKVERANYENGLLHIDLVREIPEAMKPRSIAIQAPKEALEAKRDVLGDEAIDSTAETREQAA